MEDILDVETEMTSRLSGLQKRLDKHAMHEISKDVGKIQELIKANLQRSKVIQVEERFYDATTLKGTFDLNTISTTISGSNQGVQGSRSGAFRAQITSLRYSAQVHEQEDAQEKGAENDVVKWH